MQFEERISEATSIKSSHDSDPSLHEFVQPPRALLPPGAVLSRTVRSINSELTCPICLGLLHDTVVVKEVRNLCSIANPVNLLCTITFSNVLRLPSFSAFTVFAANASKRCVTLILRHV